MVTLKTTLSMRTCEDRIPLIILSFLSFHMEQSIGKGIILRSRRPQLWKGATLQALTKSLNKPCMHQSREHFLRKLLHMVISKITMQCPWLLLNWLGAERGRERALQSTIKRLLKICPERLGLIYENL